MRNAAAGTRNRVFNQEESFTRFPPDASVVVTGCREVMSYLRLPQKGGAGVKKFLWL
jgi:hypothetical protein